MTRDDRVNLEGLPMSRKPWYDEEDQIREITVDERLKKVLDKLDVVDYNSYKEIIDKKIPDYLQKQPFLANVDDRTFFVDSAGYDYPRYMGELV